MYFVLISTDIDEAPGSVNEFSYHSVKNLSGLIFIGFLLGFYW